MPAFRPLDRWCPSPGQRRCQWRSLRSFRRCCRCKRTCASRPYRTCIPDDGRTLRRTVTLGTKGIEQPREGGNGFLCRVDVPADDGLSECCVVGEQEAALSGGARGGGKHLH